MTRYKTLMAATAAVALIAGAMPAHAQMAKPATPAAKAPEKRFSGTLDRADGDMKDVIEKLIALKGKPIETLSAAEARKQPTPTDAVMEVLKEDGKDIEKLKADLKVTTKDLMYPAGKGEQKARVYIPEHDEGEILPVVVYYHGGGFVIADIDVYDGAPRSISSMAKAIVVSAEYRHAPENKFPAQGEDAFAAYQWVLKNAASWGGDPKRIAVAGESAGGNLAANVAIMARDKGIQKPVHMLLVYPVAGNDMNTQSYRENANAKPLNKAMMEWFVKNTISKPADKNDPRINLLAAKLDNLAPATVITAEIDPLRSEGKMLADKLEKAGNKVEYRDYEGVTHEFFGMGFVVSDAMAAMKDATDDLKSSFDDAKDAQGQKR